MSRGATPRGDQSLLKYRFGSWRFIDDSRSESAVVAHFIACATAAAIADTISAIHSHPRRALPGGALELSEGARTTKRSRRCLSRCVKLMFGYAATSTAALSVASETGAVDGEN
jgi:hypothetical protein